MCTSSLHTDHHMRSDRRTELVYTSRFVRVICDSDLLRTVRRRRCRQECGLEVTVKEQQGRRMKHGNGEGEMGRYDMRTANTLSHACTLCLYATQRNCVRKMCVRHGVCVHSGGATREPRSHIGFLSDASRLQAHLGTAVAIQHAKFTSRACTCRASGGTQRPHRCFLHCCIAFLDGILR